MAASTDVTEGGLPASALLIINLFCVIPCVVLKIPQLLSLYKSKSARGVSLSSFILELISYTIFAVYMFVNSQPIMQYVEFLFLIVQVWAVILMILHYLDQVNFILLPYSALYFIAVWIVASSVTPPWFISLLLTLSTPISASGMIIQILAIYRIKDSGSVSFSSWFISWATGFLRLVTSIIAGDMLVVFSYVFTNSLRAVGCIVILYYQPSAKKLT
ncbi:PQ-loop repeat-containing protein 3-like isoform X1 [Acanthaster planci]|uniref:PQ-loop repeat-containing protein 3-like isoform X1 n=1 Tax=Acanthaster planci TaxID=133434 RepID=A0A8B7ZT17_ACAPL|nr:PQ-loop repeat-containing protein 3-like isoform X1 [Acanthaster planci]